LVYLEMGGGVCTFGYDSVLNPLKTCIMAKCGGGKKTSKKGGKKK